MKNAALYITIDGVTKSLSQWASDTGLSKDTIRSRYRRGCADKALIAPAQEYSREKRKNAVHKLWGGKWVFVGT